MNARLILATGLLALICISSATEGTKWTRQKSGDGRFTVMFPGKPRMQKFSVPTRDPKVTLTLRAWSTLVGQNTDTPADDAIYYFNTIDFPSGFMSDQQYFASREEHHLSRCSGQLTGRRLFKVQGLPCLEITWITKEGSGIARFIIAKNRHYEMLIFRRGEPSLISEKRFFASAKLR